MARSLRIDDLALDVDIPARPTRAPMLMVHGLMGGAWYFAKWLEFFSARGHPAYALNLRGHHGSRPVDDFGRVSLRDYVVDVQDAARGITERHSGSAPILVGHSMGGLVMQKAAESLATPALVLLSTVPPRGVLLLSWPLMRRELNHVPAILMSRPIIPDPHDVTALFLNRVDAAEAASFIPRWAPASGRVGREISFGSIAVDPKRIRCPTLVIAGAEDVGIPARIQRKVAKKYRATYRMYPGNAHFLIWEPGWDRIAGDVGSWLDRHVEEAAPSA